VIRSIFPYKWNDVWMFDDPSVGLVQEAIVGGTDDIIDALREAGGIKGGFRLAFSDQSFTGAEELVWLRQEMGGNVYGWNDMEGWLCPALQLYFPSPPKRLYLRVSPITN
jgi:hypothetical protein